MLFFNRAPVVPVVRFSGPIGMVTSLPDRACVQRHQAAAVAVVVNLPGGSPDLQPRPPARQ